MMLSDVRFGLAGFRNVVSGGSRLVRRAQACLLLAAAFGWLSAAAGAQTVVLSQATLLGGFPSGGAYGSGTAAGTSMAVTPAGNLIYGTSYGSSLVQINGSTGATTTLGADSNVGPVAINPRTHDLYIGNVYSARIGKLPFVNGGYPTFTDPSSASACTGSDTAECLLASSAVNGAFGLTSMAFDTNGNMFYATTNGGSGADHQLVEITAASLAGAAPSPIVLYQEPTSASAQLLIGGLAIDPSGDIFFAESAFSNQGNEVSNYSNVSEILYTGSGTTGYSPAKLILYTYTVASPGNYDDIISSVAVDAGGTTLYFATENEGIFGFSMAKGVVATTRLYTFSTQGAKVMTTDGAGNFYVAASGSSGDAISRVNIGVLTAPQTNLGSTGTASGVVTILNDVLGCASSTVTYKSSTTEYAAGSGGSCSSASLSNASVIPTTLTFTPAASGYRTATITATEANGSAGTATITTIGVGTPAAAPTFSPAGGTYTTIQSVTLSDTTANASIYYTTDGSTPTTSSTLYAGPITVAVNETINAIATAVGNAASTVATAKYVITLPAATPTFSLSSGTYNSTQTVSIGDSTAGASVYYTLDGSTPTASSKLYTGPLTVAATETINAIATAPGYIASAVGTAIYTIKLPTFGLQINPSAVTISANGGQALVNVVVTPLNTFAGAVTFACSGVPAGATCVFAPSTITPSGTYTVDTVLAVTLPGTAASLRHGNSTMFPAALALGVCLLGWRRRRGLKPLLALAVMAAGLGMMSGCSSTNAAAHSTSTSVVTVTATSGTIVQTGTLTVMAQ